MSRKVKVTLNHDAVRHLLKSQEMQNILSGYAEKMTAKNGGETEIYVAQTRAVAQVRGDDGNNSALKAMGGS